ESTIPTQKQSRNPSICIRLCKGSDHIKILAFDLSLTSPGFAVIKITKGKPKLIDCGHIKTKSSQSPSLRLRLIRNFLEGVYLRHNDVDYVVREAVVFNRRNTKTVEVLCHVAGLCIEVCTNHEVQKMNPSVAKRLVTGSKKVIRNNEKAEKKRVEEAV